ncbi:hypothetical protein V6N13_095530 [Hibiscus sabdariffa]
MWSENIEQVESATWLEPEVIGVPLHCWNHCTFRRVAELWENVEAFGENVNHTKDCEKATILISTKHDQLVELEVDNVIHNIRVLKMGFSDLMKKEGPNEQDHCSSQSYSSSESNAGGNEAILNQKLKGHL